MGWEVKEGKGTKEKCVSMMLFSQIHFVIQRLALETDLLDEELMICLAALLRKVHKKI